MIKRLTPVAALATALVFSACNGASSDEGGTPAAVDAVAIVNGTPISRDVWDLFVKTRTRGGSADDLSEEQKKESLETLIQMYVAAQQAAKDGLDKGEEGARLELMRQSALADLTGRNYLEGKEATPEELKAEYDKQVAQMAGTEYKARHILVDEEQLARDLIAKLDGGASFEQLAKENSTDSSAQEGGDLGWFAPSRMVKPFADAVQQLDKGAYTKEPVKSQFGWHVVKLDDTRPLTPPAYEAVEQQLDQLVMKNKFQAYVEELMKTATVERKL